MKTKHIQGPDLAKQLARSPITALALYKIASKAVERARDKITAPGNKPVGVRLTIDLDGTISVGPTGTRTKTYRPNYRDLLLRALSLLDEEDASDFLYHVSAETEQDNFPVEYPLAESLRAAEERLERRYNETQIVRGAVRFKEAEA